MKRHLLALTFLVGFCSQSSSQPPVPSSYIKLSGGRILFGTGDVIGFSAGIEAGKDISSKGKWGLSRLALGAELLFESGAKNPVVTNPSPEQFLFPTFNHVSSTVLWARFSYFPFPKIIKGFHLSAGPTVGHILQSWESQRELVELGPDLSIRYSRLAFDNGWHAGYRLGLGYDQNIGKRFLAGLRWDFANYSNGNMDLLAALRTGIRF